MADFCQQCKAEMDGETVTQFDKSDYGELPQPPSGTGYHVLCEGCGPTLIDEKGNCIWPCCPVHGKTKKTKETKETNSYDSSKSSTSRP